MKYLPSPRRFIEAEEHGIKKFGGLNRSDSASAEAGDISEMTNGGSDSTSGLKPRGRRRCHRLSFPSPNGLCEHLGSLAAFSGTGFYYSRENHFLPKVTPHGVYNSTEAFPPLENNEKRTASLGDMLVVFPDKVWFRPSCAAQAASWTSVGSAPVIFAGNAITKDSTDPSFTIFAPGDCVTISGAAMQYNNKRARIAQVTDGVLYFDNAVFAEASELSVTVSRAAADGNCGEWGELGGGISDVCVRFADTVIGEEIVERDTAVFSSEVDFVAGDSVTFSGCVGGFFGNNVTAVVKEVSGDRRTVKFPEKTFAATGTAYHVNAVRAVPDLDILFYHENRLWGAKDGTIYCSAENNAFNWNNFEDKDGGSWKCETLSGDFTAGCSFLGYPTFFKDDRIIRVLGDSPGKFRISESADRGIPEGGSQSAAKIGNKLIYYSQGEFCSYSGGFSKNISQKLGHIAYERVCAASDGERYFASCTDCDGRSELLVYNAESESWWREDGARVVCTANLKGVFMLTEGGELFTPGINEAGVDFSDLYLIEDAVASEFIFTGMSGDSFDKKTIIRLFLRTDMGVGSSLTLYIKSEDGAWKSAGSVTAASPQSIAFPIVPLRGEGFSLRLCGSGDFTLREIGLPEYIDKC